MKEVLNLRREEIVVEFGGGKLQGNRVNKASCSTNWRGDDGECVRERGEVVVQGRFSNSSTESAKCSQAKSQRWRATGE